METLKQSKGERVLHPHKLLFSDILKLHKYDPRKYSQSLYIGLNLHGGNVSELQIENGEKPEDYHVTLLWGMFNPRSDIDDTVCRIQSVMEEIKNDIPKRLVFYHERRFEASESSDNKDVIVAAVEGGVLETVHKRLLAVLKNEGLTVETTFPEYVPHLTLAYIEPGTEYECRVLDHSALVKDITVCIKDADTREKEYERVFGMVAKSFSEVLKFNPYHDRLGRFTTAGGAASFTYRPGASVAHDRAIARESERVKQADKVIAGTNKMASYVIENQFISSEKKQCVKELQNCYQSIAMKNSIRWDEEKQKVVAKRSAINEIKDTARKIMEKQEYEDQNTAQDYYELHRTIKRTPIKISDYDKKNIPDWNDYRKRAFGNLTISNNGISVDSFYQELSSQFPHLFNSHRETSPSDQLEKLNEVLTSLKPRTYRLSGRELEDAADDLSLQILNGYMAVIKH